jgi:DNA polymerase I
MLITHIPPTICVRDSITAGYLAIELESRPKGWVGRLALDTETTGLSITEDFPLYWSLSDGVRRWCIDAELLLEGTFDRLFCDQDRYWVFANPKYDLHMLANYNTPIPRGRKYDVIGMSLFVEDNGLHGLKAQAKRDLGIHMADFKEVVKFRRNADMPFELLNPNNYAVVSDYASLDAYVTWLLSELHAEKLENIHYGGGLTAWDYYNDIEIPYTDCLYRVERRGILVDSGVVEELRPEFDEKRRNLQADIFTIAGKPFNIQSDKQLAGVFFDTLKLKPVKYTDTGAPSLDKFALSEYVKAGVPLATKITEFREYDRLVNMYIDGHCGKWLGSDNRVHTTLNQFRTATGRLSSGDPNMQAIPSRSSEGVRLREAFVAPKGYRLGVWDYSTLEMRVMAHMSSDRAMSDAISSGMDLHAFTASQMLGVTYEHVIAAKLADDLGLEDTLGLTKRLETKAKIDSARATKVVRDLTPESVNKLLKARSVSKTIGFGVLFGAGPQKVSSQIKSSVDEAKEKMAQWFSTFPGVRRYIENAHAAILNNPHKTQTITGRFRHLPEAASPRRSQQAAAQRRAVNTPIQGSAGDLVKFAMLSIDVDPLLGNRAIDGGVYGVRMVLQVHDELIFEVPEEFSEPAAHLIKERMEDAGGINMNVPLEVAGGYGKNWREAK